MAATDSECREVFEALIQRLLKNQLVGLIGLNWKDDKKKTYKYENTRAMKLYFLCPVNDIVFGSDDYSLLRDFKVVQDGENQRELKGIVVLNGDCPLCGQKHQYQVKDVICSLSGGENDE